MTVNTILPVSVVWDEGIVRILNQQKLPEKTEFKALRTIEDVWEAIVALQVRGAPAIGIVAAFGLNLGIQQLEEMSAEQFLAKVKECAEYLIGAMPTADNLAWAVNRVVHAAHTETTVEAMKETMLNEALNIQKEEEEIYKKIGEYTLLLLDEAKTVMTHCNADSIATSRYGTALAALHLAKERGEIIACVATETRPVLQGARLAAWELQQNGVPVTLITDNMVSHVLSQGNVDAIIVGADRIANNGDTANKIGTLQLAIVANHFHIPFYVCAPLSTIDTSIASGKEIKIEERPSEEVTTIQGVQIAPAGIDVYNPAFDITPSPLITAIITEKGIVKDYYEQVFRLWEEEE